MAAVTSPPSEVGRSSRTARALQSPQHKDAGVGWSLRAALERRPTLRIPARPFSQA